MSFDIKELLPALELSQKDICDQSLPSALADKKAASPELAFSIAGIDFNAEAEGAYKLSLFNDANDHPKDPKVFDHWKEASSYYGNQALLAHGLNGKIKASASGSALEKFEFGVDAEKSMEVTSYRIHDCGSTLAESFVSDVESFKIIFDKQSVLNLDSHEALSYESAGKLNLKASVKISDVINGTASIVSNFLNLKGKINLKVDASASLNFALGIEDDFKVIIIKLEADKYRVLINKLVKRSKELKFKAGIEAGIENDDDFKELADQFFEGIDEKVFKPINKKIENAGLSEADTELIQKAVNLLDLDIEVPKPADFQKLYEKKRDDVKKLLIETVTSKVSVGLSYEYRQVKSNESLFEAELTKVAMDQFHSNIISLQMGALIDAYQNDNSIFELKKYLRRETTEITKSFGIDIAFGKFKLTSSVTKEFKEVKTYKYLGDKGFGMKVDAYNRKTTKKFKHGKNKDEYVLNIDASMPVYVEKEENLTSEKFDFEFGLGFEMVERKTDDKELRDMVDWALTWDIIKQSQVDTTFEKIKKEVLDTAGNNVAYSIFIKIPEGEFNELIPRFKNVRTLIPSALAASLLQLADIFQDSIVRNNLSLRRSEYREFWRQYLIKFTKSRHSSFAKWVTSELESSFFKKGFEDLSFFESGDGNFKSYNASRVISLIKINNIGKEIDRWLGGLESLAEAMDDKVHYERKFKEAFKRIDQTRLLQDFDLRFLGRLLLDMNSLMNEKVDIETGFSIKYKIGEKEKILVIA